MNHKDDKIFLQHIIESIELIEDYVRNLSEDEFLSSVRIQDAVFRRFEIIGEATKNISNDLKEKSFYIPWQKMAGMRNKLIHEYFGVDSELVWQTIKEFLPIAKKDIVELINKLK